MTFLSGGPNGAEASATFFSLIQTAKANDLEPYAYLCYLFSKIPSTQNEADFLNRIGQTIIDATVTRAVE